MSKKHKEKPTLNFDDESKLYTTKKGVKEFSSSISKLNSGLRDTGHYGDERKTGKIPAHSKELTQAKKMTQLGWECFCNKEYEKAIEYYDRALIISSDYKTASKNKALAASKYGKLLDERGQFVEAEKYLTLALTIQTDNPFVHHNLGNLYHYAEMPIYDKATYHYKKALVYANRDNKFNIESTNRQLALLPRHAIKFYLEKEDYDEAAKYITSVDKLASNDEVSLTRVADLMFKNGNIDEAAIYSNKAIKALLEKLEQNVGNESIDLKLLNNKMFTHNDSALKIFLIATQRDENSSLNWKNLGINLYSGQPGRKGEAMKCLEVALFLEKDDIEALYYASCLLRDMGQAVYALESCRELLKLRESSVIELYKIYCLGAELDTLNERELSVLYDHRVISAKENSAYGLLERGKSLYAIGKFDEAISQYNKSLQINRESTQSSSILYHKALAKMAINEYIGAIKLFDQALGLTSDTKDMIYNYKGVALLTCGEYAEAIDCFTKAIEIKRQAVFFFNTGVTKIFGNDSRQDSIYQAFKDFKVAYEISNRGEHNVNSDTKALLKKVLLKANKFLPKDYKVCSDIVSETCGRLYKAVWEMHPVLKTGKKKIAEFKKAIIHIPEKIIEFQKSFAIEIINEATLEIEAIADPGRLMESKAYDSKVEEVVFMGDFYGSA